MSGNTVEMMGQTYRLGTHGDKKIVFVYRNNEWVKTNNFSYDEILEKIRQMRG